MWNKICCKSEYKEYLKNQQDALLVKNLMSMKSRLDNSKPKTLTQKSLKPLKKHKKKSIRAIQIHEENKSLIQRMLRIDLKSQQTEKKNPRYNLFKIS